MHSVLEQCLQWHITAVTLCEHGLRTHERGVAGHKMPVSVPAVHDMQLQGIGIMTGNIVTRRTIAMLLRVRKPKASRAR